MNGKPPELARTQAWILAGGQGERLHPLTLSRPKPVVSFGGMFRIIDFTLSNCLHSGLNRVAVLTQYRSEEIHRYVRKGWWEIWNEKSDRSPLLCFPPSSGKRYRGTADAIFQNRDLLHSDPAEFVLVLGGDHIYQMDYGELLRRHAETDADLTAATVEHPLADAAQFGVVEVDRDFRITGFQEKPSNPRPLPDDPATALVSMGVYVFKKRVLLDALDEFCDTGLGFDFGRDIIPALIRSARACAYDFHDNLRDEPRYWRDIGTIDAYYQASMDLVQPDPPFDPFANDGWPSEPTRHPCFHGAGAPSHHLPILGNHSRITRTVISPDVDMEDGAFVEESVLMPGVHVGSGARLRRTIVEEGVQVPAGFRSGFDLEDDGRQHTVTEDGIVVISRTPIARKSAALAYSRAG